MQEDLPTGFPSAHARFPISNAHAVASFDNRLEHLNPAVANSKAHTTAADMANSRLGKATASPQPRLGLYAQTGNLSNKDKHAGKMTNLVAMVHCALCDSV